MSPIVVLSSTLLPVPDGPTMARISPRATSRLTPSSTGASKRLCTSRYSMMASAMSVEEQRREDGVRDEHGDDHEHHRGGGRSTDAFRAAGGEQPHVHGNERDDEAEGHPLHDTIEHVPAVPVEAGAVQERLRPEVG